MKKVFSAACLLILVLMMVFPGIAADKPLRLVLSFHDPSVEWAQPMKSGVDDASQEFGFAVSFIGPTPIDSAKQIEQVRTLVEQNMVDGLAITAMDPSFRPLIDELIENGIPVLTVVNDDPASKRMAFIGQPLEAIEQTAYEMTREFAETTLKGVEGKVAILCALPEIEALMDRVNGTRRALEEFPNLEVLPGIYTKGQDINKAYADIESLLTAHPDIVGLISTEATTTPTAGHIVRDKGLQDMVHVAGYDVTMEAVDLVSDASIDLLVGQFPYNQGYLSMKVLYEYLTEGITPQSIDVGAEYITPANVADQLSAMGR